jgi:hypothetical protein
MRPLSWSFALKRTDIQFSSLLLLPIGANVDACHHIMIIIKLNSLFICVLNSTARGQLQMQHEYKTTKRQHKDIEKE